MSFLLKIKPKYRLQIGLMFLILAAFSFYLIWNYDTGFIGGFLAGIFIGIGLGLIITHKKQE
jgi:hypothetical protein